MEPIPPAQKIPNLLQTARQGPQATGIVDPGPSPEALEKRRRMRLVAFDAVAVIAAGLLGASCLLYVADALKFPWLLAATAFFLLASFFSFLLGRGSQKRFLVGLLQIAAFLGFFYAVQLSALLSAAGILLAFYFFATRAAGSVADNSLKFSLWNIARLYMRKVFTGLALAVIVLYLPQANTGNVFVSREQFQRWYGGFADFAQGFYAHIDLKASVGSFAEDIARTELAANSQFANLPPDLQDRAVAESARALIANAAKSAGFEITADMPLGDAFYRYLLGLFDHFRQQFGQSFLAVWAAALFAVVWSLGAVFVWIVVALAYLVYELLAALNLVRIAGEMRTRESVELA